MERRIKRLLGWRRESSFDRPATMKPVVGSLVFQVEAFAPNDERMGFPLIGDKVIPALIPLLLRACGPLAVFWAITLVIVASLQSKFLAGPLTHVREEILKGIKPVLANDNAAAAIIRIAFVSWIEAPPTHSVVAVESQGVRFAMCRHAPSCRLRSETTTTSRAFAFAEKVMSRNDFLRAAITTAKPHGPFVGVADEAKDKQAAETLALELAGGTRHDAFLSRRAAQPTDRKGKQTYPTGRASGVS
jgi:hypothetical protein